MTLQAAEAPLPTLEVDVAEIIDRGPLRRLQVQTALLCGLVAILDGLDNFSMSLAAPLAAADFHVALSTFGTVFGINSFGMMIGALGSGPIADRFGRKPLILGCLLLIGLFALVTPFASSFGGLLLVRLLAGIGAGGVMPNIIALTAEYAPKRLRATLVTVMFIGIPFGAILAGLVSLLTIDRFGWRGVFYVGGLIPFLLLPLLVLSLPESIRFLIVRGQSPQRSLALLRRLCPSLPYPDGTICRSSEPARRGMPISQLFQDGRATTTLLLWTIFVCNLVVWFFLVSWLPGILQQAHYRNGYTIKASMVLYVGGMIGGIALGRAVDRTMSYRLLGTAYVASAVSLCGMGYAAMRAPSLLLPMVFATGFFVAGCQYCISAFAAALYPTELRSTGVGWALGIGRIGAIGGPVIGGMMIGLHWTLGRILAVSSLPALLAAVATILVARLLSTRTAR